MITHEILEYLDASTACLDEEFESGRVYGRMSSAEEALAELGMFDLDDDEESSLLGGF